MQIADFGFRIRDMFDIQIRNPQSKIRNKFCSTTPLLGMYVYDDQQSSRATDNCL